MLGTHTHRTWHIPIYGYLDLFLLFLPLTTKPTETDAGAAAGKKNTAAAERLHRS
jgi:hypothetical protein